MYVQSIKLNTKHSAEWHPFSITMHFCTHYKIAASCTEMHKSTTGKKPKDCKEAAVCHYSTAPGQKCCTDSPSSFSSSGLAGCATVTPFLSWTVLPTPASTFHSCTNPFLAVLKHLIVMQGCRGLLNKISPSGFFF